MENKEKIFFGELGEIINPYVSSVKPEGNEQHFSVAIDIDGFTIDDDDRTTLIISPSEAKRLSDKLLELADNAYEANYNILLHKAPF